MVTGSCSAGSSSRSRFHELDVSNRPQTISAVVAAGDAKAAKPIYGQSKPYLPVAGRPLVVRLVLALQDVSEVSDVWVVGNR